MTDPLGRQDRQIDAGHIPGPPLDDRLQWMEQIAALDDRELDALLGGETPAGADELEPVADFARALRARVRAEPLPAMRPSLAAALDREAAGARAPRAGLRRTSSRAAAAAAVAVFATGGLGVAAAQHALPDAVQDFVSAAAEVVGLDVPPAHEHDEPAPSGDERQRPASTPGGAVPAEPGGPGEPATPAQPPARGDAGGASGGNEDPGTPPAHSNSSTGGDPGQPAPPPQQGTPPAPPDQGGGGGSAPSGGGAPPETTPSTVPERGSSGETPTPGAPAAGPNAPAG